MMQSKLLSGLLLVSFLMISIPSNAQESLRFTKQQVLEDFAYLKFLLNRYHPNAQTLDFNRQFETHVQDLDIRNNVSIFEANRLVSSMMPVIKDGHTQFTISPKSWQPFKNEARFFPLKVFWDGTSLYMLKNIHDHFVAEDSIKTDTIPIGSKLISINGMPCTKLIEDMISYFMRDGENLSYPTWVVNNYFFEYFPDFYGLHESYTIEYNAENGITQKIELDGIYQIDYYLIDGLTNPGKAAIDLTIENQLGVLTIGTWHDHIARKDYGQKLRPLLKEKMESIIDSNVDNLIIDLRDNQGGNMNHSVRTLSYLLDEPFEMIPSIRRVKKGEFIQIETKQTGMHQPNKKQYTGHLFVLINGGSFSNTGIFSSTLQRYERATFIGSETGGSASVLCYNPYKFKLPHTRLSVQIPSNQAILQPNEEDKNHGVIPDHKISPTLKSILEEKDPVMTFTLDLIKKQTNE